MERLSDSTPQWGQNQRAMSSQKKVALITGITGQDGSYLTEFLLSKGYVVYGLVRRTSRDSDSLIRGRLRECLAHPDLALRYGDVLDPTSLRDALDAISTAYPEAPRLEVYNLAAQSHVHASFEMPSYTAQTDGIGTLNVLEALRACRIPVIRLCQASTSEMFGSSPPPQNETTPFQPRSPYGASKLFAYWMVRNYREAHGVWACNAISFNHESERREPVFVSRKITRGVARIATGATTDPLVLGNLYAMRDWSHAADVVRAMWHVLQVDEPDDYVVASGVMHSVKEFVEEAFRYAGIVIQWRGTGDAEVGVSAETGQVMVRVDPSLMRPAEVDALQGDASKVRRVTGWKPTIDFHALVRRMVDHDMRECGSQPL